RAGAAHPVSVLAPRAPPGPALAAGEPLQRRDAPYKSAPRPHATPPSEGPRTDRPWLELSGVELAARTYRCGPPTTEGGPYHPSADPGTPSASRREHPGEVPVTVQVVKT